jgi:hypothetical protein
MSRENANLPIASEVFVFDVALAFVPALFLLSPHVVCDTVTSFFSYCFT